ncbi:MAG: BPL-N domain-containing protein [Nanoarchaeota archaeon]
MKINGLFLALVVFLSVAVLAQAVSSKALVCPITSSTNIAIYGDTGFGGVGDLSKSWIGQFLNWWRSYDSNISYVFLTSNNVKSDCNLLNYPNVKLYIQPGGNAYYQQKSLGAAGKTNILNYINSNGSYLGICAGFFYAANDYYWQGSYYNWRDMLDIFPTVEGSIADIADYDQNPGYALTSLANGFNAVYYGGPTQGWRSTAINIPAGGEVKTTFSAIPGNLPAVVKLNKMLLTSVHLEAFENDGIAGLSTEQRVENYKLLANLINEAAGTSYFVPAYVSNLTQCNDWLDNDADNLIDMNDPGCSSPNDNDEFNSQNSSSGTLFYDDFESGSLTGWIFTKSSGANNWVNVNLNPYQGLRHAQSQPMSTTNPASLMEKMMSTSGYSNIKLSYYRRLVGLDSADEFQAKWFDGSIWNILEQTGGNSANDASYVFKQFNLPSSADNNVNFKIKFECTAGAVSEFCRVDDVKVFV